jgi:hypothetical protein
MNPEMRNMLLSLDGVYDPKAPGSGESEQSPEPSAHEHTS